MTEKEDHRYEIFWRKAADPRVNGVWFCDAPHEDGARALFYAAFFDRHITEVHCDREQSITPFSEIEALAKRK